MRVKWKMAVGALALAAWVQIPAWSVKARGEVYVSDSLYDWSGNADRSQSSGSLLSPSSPLSPPRVRMITLGRGLRPRFRRRTGRRIWPWGFRR